MHVMSNEETLRITLEHLRQDHRDLDDAIEAMTERPVPDQIAIRRLKKRKLLLRDEIARLEDLLTPDIIA